jgi:hypothetical protein
VDPEVGDREIVSALVVFLAFDREGVQGFVSLPEPARELGGLDAQHHARAGGRFRLDELPSFHSVDRRRQRAGLARRVDEVVVGAPLATELLYLEAGEHELVFEPPAAGEVHGRLVADGARELYGLQLAGEDGRALSPVHAIRASGEFRLRELGCGRCRLRFGSLAELKEGCFRRELALEVIPGENQALEVRL